MQSLGLNYKRLPLIDISAALSWRGSPYGLRDQVVRAVRNHPRLDAWLRRGAVNRCHAKRIDASRPEFRGGANLSHMLGLWGRSACVRESS
jgi:hypothetical protein